MPELDGHWSHAICEDQIRNVHTANRNESSAALAEAPCHHSDVFLHAHNLEWFSKASRKYLQCAQNSKLRRKVRIFGLTADQHILGQGSHLLILGVIALVLGSNSLVAGQFSSPQLQPSQNQDISALGGRKGDRRLLHDALCSGCLVSQYVVNTSAGVLSCADCPIGAGCSDGVCALRFDNQTCSESSDPILGTWSREYQLGPFHLTSCPRGHQRISHSHGAQRCLACLPTQYIFDPNNQTCQPCPPGLLCQGNDEVQPVLNGSVWRIFGEVIILESCPTGYRVFNEFDSLQRCEPCGLGQECTSAACTECMACPRGMYKDAVGTQACSRCPVNTYGPNSGAVSISQCLQCPAFSFTTAEMRQTVSGCICAKERYMVGANDSGTHTCSVCPVGLTCSDGDCAADIASAMCSSGQLLVGKWEIAEDGRAMLLSCPDGYSLVNSTEGTSSGLFAHDLQHCKQCDTHSEYVLRPNIDRCQECPPGLLCQGNDEVQPVLNGSVWRIFGEVIILESCPTGYRVFNEFDSLQRCEPCGLGQECTSAACTECMACPRGMYKDAVGTQACSRCPVNTYGPNSGAVSISQCLQCPAFSFTTAEMRQTVSGCICAKERYMVGANDSGTHTCSVCPVGLTCSDGDCAADIASAMCSSGQLLVGKWEIAEDGRAMLLSCPDGYSLVNSTEGTSSGLFAHDLQHCKQCGTDSEYVLRPNIDRCQECPPGLRCSGGINVIPVLNGSRWVAQGAIYKLISCPAGYFPFAFAVGNSLHGQECVPCGKGEECVTDRCDSCTPCQVGHFKDAVAPTACSPCPPDTYRDHEGGTELASCFDCPPHASTNGNVSQTRCSCEEGFYEDGHYCSQCEAGSWCSGGQQYSCPLQAISPPGSRFLINCTCPNGFVGLPGQACVDCSPGSWCAGGIEIGCPQWATSTERSSSAEDCRCNAGYSGRDGGPCTACSAGWYKVEKGDGECVACPEGTYSQTVGADSFECQPCPWNSTSEPGSGSFSNCLCLAGFAGGWGSCLECPAGTYKQDIGTGDCTLCESGTFSTKRAADSPMTCETCPHNYTDSIAGSASLGDCMCNAGYTGPDGGICNACEAGAFKETSGSQPCTACAGGKYSELLASTSGLNCRDCPDPNSHSRPGGASITACLCNSGFTGPDSGPCTACWAGTYKVVNGSSSCDSCPPDTYLPAIGSASSSCLPCPDQHSESLAGSQLAAQCICSRGYTGPGGGPCTACLPGSFKSQNGSAPCGSCPTGSASIQAGATGVRDCLCEVGFYGIGGESCEPCEPGNWCAEGRQIPCPFGTTSPAGSTALLNCTCDAGYSGVPGLACTACEAGTYCNQSKVSLCPNFTTSEPRSSRLEHCQCIAGYTGVDGGPCTECPAGRYKEAIGSGECHQCPPATFSTFVGSFSASFCTPCPDNAISESGSASFSQCLCLPGYSGNRVWGQCLACAGGTFKIETGVGGCTECLAGKYSTATAAISNSTCQECPQNSESQAGSSSRDHCICSAGFVGPAGGVCAACSPGKYLSVVPGRGSTTEADCERCPTASTSAEASSGIVECHCNAGFSGPNGGPCSACPAGTFKSGSGSAACSNCYAGTYSPNEHATSNLTCAHCPFDHSHSHAGSANLQDCTCNAGYFGPDGMSCTACPPGSYKTQRGSQACVACLAGKYSAVEGATHPGVCANCPSNASSSANASNSLESCMCNAGYTGPNGGECTACAAGTYKEQIGSSGCTSCPRDFYSNQLAAMSPSTCHGCPPNSTSGAGSQELTSCICKAGFFGLPGGLCLPCPEGSWCDEGFRHDCPVNSSSPPESRREQNCKCLAGFSGNHVSTCSICLEGMWCPGGNVSNRCPENSTSAAQSSKLTDCSCFDGYIGRAGAACSECPPNSWCSEGQEHQCPQWTSSGPLSVLPESCRCNSGYSGPDGGPCTVCPAGWYKEGPGKGLCQECSAGTFSQVIAAVSRQTCQQCPPNSTSAPGSVAFSHCRCIPGHRGLWGICSPCEAGTFKEEIGDGDCMPCPAGMISGMEGAVSNATCTHCPENHTHSDAGGASVRSCLCNEGYSGPDGGPCMPCEAGKYKTDRGSEQCTACPQDTFQASLAATDETACLACAWRSSTRGAVAQPSIDRCLCDPEYYLVVEGERICVNCPVGARCLDGSCGLSDAGASCTTNSTEALGIWTRQQTLGRYELVECPLGHYRSTDVHDAQRCVECGRGEECITRPCLACSACLAGWYKDTVGPAACSACPADTYRAMTGGADITSCTPCPSHSTTEQRVAQTSIEACACDATHYLSFASPETRTCETCPIGAICSDGVCALGDNETSGSCQQLPQLRGMWQRETSMGPFELLSCGFGYAPSKEVHDDQQCVECGRGQQCVAPPCEECTPCPPGTYKDFVGATPCVPCPPDRYREAEGGTELESCTACPMLSSTLGSTGQVGVDSCACDAPYYLIVEGGTRKCETCPIGAVCPDGTCALNSQNGSCVPVGQWLRGSWDGFGAFELVTCPRGYQLISGLHDGQRCHKCSMQQYILDSNTDECQPCPPGLTCEGTDVVTPTLRGSVWRPIGSVMVLESCPAGYRVFSSIADAQECVPCGKGEECTTSSCVSCTPCQAGYYKDVVGDHACWPCPVNTYRGSPGATERDSCLACPYRSTTLGNDGQTDVDACVCGGDYYRVHQNDGSIRCQSCLPGATCADRTCALQATNFLCADGTVVGEWRHGSDVVQEFDWLFVLVGCPSGYQLVNPSFDRQECLLCSRTEYIIDSNAHECQPCPPGLQCRGNHVVAPTVNGSEWTIVGEQFRLRSCPTGYFVFSGPEDGSQQECLPCGAGEECTSPPCITCSRCLPGWYKDHTSSEPCRPCPHNTYRIGEGAVDIANCLDCPARSTTLGQVGQSSVEACECDEQFYLQVAADGERTCRTCPVGAVCSDRRCALRVEAMMLCGFPPQPIVGNWRPVEDLPFPEFVLESCDAGYQRIGGIHDAQECHPCSGNEYILDPNNHTCQKCPPGLHCNGNDQVVPVIEGSVWMAEGAIMVLQWCPAGYLTFVDATADGSTQECIPCGKGEECPNPPCTVSCTPCEAGFFKDFVGADDCHPCPHDTYRERPGASDIHACLSCPARSSTMGLEGQQSLEACVCDVEYYLAISEVDGHRICTPCPFGALCADSSCALRGTGDDASCPDGSNTVVGEWKRPIGTMAEFRLITCPAGYQRLTTLDNSAAHDLQRCVRCEQGEYIIDGNMGHHCVKCPSGALCPDGIILEAKANRSIWVPNMATGMYTLVSCPAGHQKINSTVAHAADGTLIEQFSHDAQECRPCDEDAQYIVDPNRHVCECCPTGASCDGSSLTGLVEGSVWTANDDLGLYFLTSCPPKTQLVNSSTGTSRGEFSYRIQMCKQCQDGTEYVIDPNKYSCQPCPVGGDCASGFFVPRLNTSTWSIDHDLGQWILEACPSGYQRVNQLAGKFNNAVQECRKCDEDTQYIIDSNRHECQPCCPGLHCFGNETVVPVTPGSIWRQLSPEDGFYTLESCPTGYEVYNGPTGLFVAAEQTCRPCGRGQHCTNVSCTTCQNCRPGTFKEFIGTESCRLCPESTYNPAWGADQPSACKACPNGADTEGKLGQVDIHACRCTSEYYSLQKNESDEVGCELCPNAVFCEDRSCPFNSDRIAGGKCPVGSTDIVGEWEFDPENGQLQVVACPPGHELLSREVFGHALQACRRCLTCRDSDEFCHQAEYVVDPDRFACQQCPIGAVCNGIELRTRNGLDGTGDVIWEADENGRMWLQACPPGHRLDNNTYDLQECQQCEANEFILNSADPTYECQICPNGMSCLNGGPPITDQIVKSSLDIEGLSVPDGFSFREELQIKNSLLETLGTTGNIEISERCWKDTGECFELNSRRALLKPGRRNQRGISLTVSVSIPADSLSPEDVQSEMNSSRFRKNFEEEMADLGQNVAATFNVAQLDEFATIAGNFEVRGNNLILTSCPVGYLLINSSLDEQQCLRCQPLSYSFDPLDGCYHTSVGELFCPMRDCLECAVGAQCLGGSNFEPRVPASTWGIEADQLDRKVQRLLACPSGYVLIRDPRRPTFDQCLQCPPGKFSVVDAIYPHTMVSNRSEEAEGLCQPCESACVEGARCADCAGGNDVTPREGFWTLPQRRRDSANQTKNVVEVYSCSTGACLPGGKCANGRDPSGPICGFCRDGWALAGTDCMQCGRLSDSSYQYVLLGFIVPVLLVVLYYFSWRPLFHSHGDLEEVNAPTGPTALQKLMALQICKPVLRCFIPIHRQYEEAKNRARGIVQYVLASSVTDYAKIFISFWQVVSTFETNYTVSWPGEIKKVWEVGSYLRLNLVSIPGPNCMTTNTSYKVMLRAYTAGPLVVAIVLLCPTLVMVASGLKERFPLKFKAVFDLFWYSVMFWFYLLYPLLSIVTVQGFNCKWIGGDHLLIADLKLNCPSDDLSSEIFWMTVISTALYPLGIPLFFYTVLKVFKIPEIVRKKRDNAVLHEVIMKHKKLTAQTLTGRIASYVGGNSENKKMVDSRSKQMFKGASRVDGEDVRVTASRLYEFLHEIGIRGDHEEELEDLVRAFDVDRSGNLDLEEFRKMIHKIVELELAVSGVETIEDIADVQLETLCRFRWTEVFAQHEEAEEGSNLAKKFQQSLMTPGTPSSAQGGTPSSQRSRRKTYNTFTKRLHRVDSSFSRRHHDHHHSGHQSSTGSVHSENEDESRHVCPVPRSGSREEKLTWLLGQGEEMVFRGILALPVLRWDGETEEEQLVIDRIGFLFDAYEMDYWYYELIEMARKFAMSGLIVFIRPGSPQQIAAAFIISVSTLFYFVKSSPYVSAMIDNLQTMSLASQSITLFYGLMLSIQSLQGSNEEVSSTDETTMKWIILFLNLFIFVLPPFSILYEQRDVLFARCKARWCCSCPDEEELHQLSQGSSRFPVHSQSHFGARIEEQKKMHHGIMPATPSGSVHTLRPPPQVAEGRAESAPITPYGMISKVSSAGDGEEPNAQGERIPELPAEKITKPSSFLIPKIPIPPSGEPVSLPSQGSFRNGTHFHDRPNSPSKMSDSTSLDSIPLIMPTSSPNPAVAGKRASKPRSETPNTLEKAGSETATASPETSKSSSRPAAQTAIEPSQLSWRTPRTRVLPAFKPSPPGHSASPNGISVEIAEINMEVTDIGIQFQSPRHSFGNLERSLPAPHRRDSGTEATRSSVTSAPHGAEPSPSSTSSAILEGSSAAHHWPSTPRAEPQRLEPSRFEPFRGRIEMSRRNTPTVTIPTLSAAQLRKFEEYERVFPDGSNGSGDGIGQDEEEEEELEDDSLDDSEAALDQDFDDEDGDYDNMDIATDMPSLVIPSLTGHA